MERTAVRGDRKSLSHDSRLKGSEGTFERGGGEALTSSGAKLLLRGVFTNNAGEALDALLVMFERDDGASYAREVATLAQAQLMRVGPRLLCPYMPLPSGRLALVEEDAGISLERALSGDGIPREGKGASRIPLHPVGTDERALEVRKVLFDVIVQLDGFHERGIYHRDLRPANVCVRRYGDGPQDLRATLVDFDLSSQGPAARISYDNQPYVHLFRTIPSDLGIRQGVIPSALEIDMGYLVALAYVALTGRPVETASAESLAGIQGTWPLFGYHMGPNPYFARRINGRLDIAPIVSGLGLLPVNDATYPDPAVRAMAWRVQREGYVDAYDRSQLRERHPEGAVYDAVEDLARRSYASYLAQAVENGQPVAYEAFEQQPSTLVESTREQVRDIPNKVFALGLRIVNRDGRDHAELVEEFSPDEVEYLAFLEHERWCAERRADGWKLGPKKCVEKRISDALVPYDELSEANKEYNRVHAREIPHLLASVGLGIVRAG